MDDIENNGYNFTDGCGEMSLDVAEKVVENLSLKTYQTLNQKHKVGTDPVNLRAALRILSLGGGGECHINHFICKTELRNKIIFSCNVQCQE